MQPGDPRRRIYQHIAECPPPIPAPTAAASFPIATVEESAVSAESPEGRLAGCEDDEQEQPCVEDSMEAAEEEVSGIEEDAEAAEDVDEVDEDDALAGDKAQLDEEIFGGSDSEDDSDEGEGSPNVTCPDSHASSLTEKRPPVEVEPAKKEVGITCPSILVIVTIFLFRTPRLLRWMP